MNKNWPHNGKSKYSNKRPLVGGERLGKEPIVIFEKGGDTMKEFWKLLRESVIIQGVVTVLFCGTTCYLIATGQQVPGELWGANGVVLGYFFGAKTQSIISQQKNV